MMLSTVQLPGSSSFLLVCWVFATLTVSSFGAEISDVSSESEAFHDLDAFELINQGDAQGLAELLALGRDPNKKTGDGKYEIKRRGWGTQRIAFHTPTTEKLTD